MEAHSITGARVHTYGNLDSITIDTVPIPELEESQILIRVECAPINIIDLMQPLGHYNTQPLPHFFGNEGSGTVVKSGIDPYAQSLVGKRVSFETNVQGFGSYANYTITSASRAFPLRDSVTFEQGASLIINPMTVALMVEKLKEGNHTSVIINAAASALGKMLIRWCKLLNITTINLVRRQEQVDALVSIGAEHIFNTSNDGWKNAVKALTTQLETKIGFDAIGGSATQDMIELLTANGILYTYGILSGQPVQVMLFGFLGDKSIRGLFLGSWLRSLSNEKRLEIGYQVQDLIADALKTDYLAEITLDGLKDALKQYAVKKTDSKYLVRPRRS